MRNLGLVGLLVLGQCATASCAVMETLYGAGGAYLWTIDTATRSRVGFMGAGDLIRGMSSEPATETLYGAGGAYLWTIDRNTGARSRVGFMGAGDTIEAMSFEPSTGRLYGAGGAYLWTIDTNTGSR